MIPLSLFLIPGEERFYLVTSIIESNSISEYVYIMTSFLRSAIFWGFILWLIGYVLGILLFVVLPPSLIGWIIMPIGVMITLWVLFKKIKASSFQQYIFVGIIWTVIAIVCDYFLLVQLFKPVDGYYKPDVYLYYVLTFLLPIFVGWKKRFQLR